MKLLCYIYTFTSWEDFKMFLKALWNWGALYINHEYFEQKSYIKKGILYEPIKCKRCGDISIAWRQL